jgi:hypothetical protein
MRFALTGLCSLALATGVPAASFEVTTTADSGSGSLRQAILDANVTTAVDDVTFNIAGSGPFTIAPLTPLPVITQPLRIDGYSQPGSVPNSIAAEAGGLDATLMVELSGSNLPNAIGLDFNSVTTSGENLVRGLNINRFATAIRRYAGAPIRIEGCFLGTDPTGSSVPAPIDYGIELRIAGADQIGGTLPAQRNLISGARRTLSSTGIDLWRIAANGGPLILGNLIGTDRTGTVALANRDGIAMSYRFTPVVGAGARIGGEAMGSRNLISGNERQAILISCSGGLSAPCAGGTEIAGNYIGTDISGEGAVPNGAGGNSGGIALYNQTAFDTRIVVGGYTPAAANRIGHSVGYGLRHAGSHGVLEIRRNLLPPGSGAAIDLNGPRANDAGDPDLGANRLQNHPVIVAAGRVGDELTIDYLVDSTVANASYPLAVEFYRSSGDSAVEFLGADSYESAEATLIAQVVLPLSPGSPELPRITAIATDSLGHSSELSDDFITLPQLFKDGFD